MTTTTVYSAVVGSKDDARFDAYLYDHSRRLAEVSVGRFTVYLFATTATDHSHAVALAHYQSGRLQSGLFGELTVANTRTAALNAVKHWIDGEIKHVINVS